jgi:hypothetical protein
MSSKKSVKHAYRVKRPGPKRPKVLPPLGNDMSLHKYGYTLQDSAKARSTSLKRASKVYGPLPVLRRVNLIRNYTKSVPVNYKKLSVDVEFLKKEYKRSKKSKKSKK